MANGDQTKDLPRILVVDDAPANLTLMSGLLKEEFRVQAVTSGDKALKVAMSDKPPDIILLDVMMPEMDGYEVCKRLRSDERTRNIPIIFLTARSEVEDEEKGLSLGAVDYITKPISPAIALARIRTHLTLYRQRKELLDAQEVISEELSEAADYVRALLPGPLQGGVKTAWQHIPSTALGGDAFGYHWIDKDNLAIYLLDVCGHGVGAALLSISAMNTLRSQSKGIDYRSPSSVLASLNENFQMEQHNNKYFTIWYGVYSRDRKEISFASAGHPPALLTTGSSPDILQTHQLGTKNPAIGCFSDTEFEEGRITLGNHNKLFIYSDGVYEFRDQNEQTMKLTDFVQLMDRFKNVERFETDDILTTMQSLKNSDDAFEDDFSLLEVIIQH